MHFTSFGAVISCGHKPRFWRLIGSSHPHSSPFPFQNKSLKFLSFFRYFFFVGLFVQNSWNRSEFGQQCTAEWAAESRWIREDLQRSSPEHLCQLSPIGSERAQIGANSAVAAGLDCCVQLQQECLSLEQLRGNKLWNSFSKSNYNSKESFREILGLTWLCKQAKFSFISNGNARKAEVQEESAVLLGTAGPYISQGGQMVKANCSVI